MKILKNILNSEKTYVVLITIVLASLLLNYAFGSISLGVFLVFCLLNLFQTTPKLVKAYLPFVALFGLTLLSLFWTIDFQKSIRGLSKFAPLFLIPLAFICIPNLSKKGIDKILDYFATSNTIFAFLFFGSASFNFLKSHDTSAFFYHNLVSLFDLNAIYVSSFFLLSYGYLISKKNFNKITVFKTFILLIAIILLSSKLIIFLLFLISIVAFFVSKIQKKTKVIIIMFLISGTFLITQTNTFKERINNELEKDFFEVLKNDDFSMDFYPWSGSSLRLFQIRVFYELLQKDKFFFTGYGVNASQGKIVEKHIQYKLYPGFYHVNFHNQYVQIFSELGLFGFIGIVIVLSFVFINYYETKNKLVLIVFILFSTLFFTESYLCTQRGIIHFMFYMCLMLFPSYKLNSELTT